MTKVRVWRTILIIVILVITVGCDQVSKSIVRNRILETEKIPVIKNYVTLMRVENEGAFLSLGDSLPETVRFIVLSLFPLAILGFGMGYLFTRRNLSTLMLSGFSCVIGGGIGNLYDRLVYGSVTDFLHIEFVMFQTGIFNLADVSIMAGILIVLIGSFDNQSKRDTTMPIQ